MRYYGNKNLKHKHQKYNSRMYSLEVEVSLNKYIIEVYSTDLEMSILLYFCSLSQVGM